MIFDGMNFRRSRSIVAIPRPDNSRYIAFGKTCKPGTKNAVRTNSTWTVAPPWADDGDAVYAVPIKMSGHSLVNMAYGESFREKRPFGAGIEATFNFCRVFLCKGGVCYTTKIQIPDGVE